MGRWRPYLCSAKMDKNGNFYHPAEPSERSESGTPSGKVTGLGRSTCCRLNADMVCVICNEGHGEFCSPAALIFIRGAITAVLDWMEKVVLQRTSTWASTCYTWSRLCYCTLLWVNVILKTSLQLSPSSHCNTKDSWNVGLHYFPTSLRVVMLIATSTYWPLVLRFCYLA